MKDLTDEEAVALSFTENLQRENLTPDEEADGVATLYRMHGSMSKVGEAVNKSKSWVQNQLEAKGIIDTLRKEKGVQHAVRLPEDTTKIARISTAAKALFPDKPKKQVELFDATADLLAVRLVATTSG